MGPLAVGSCPFSSMHDHRNIVNVSLNDTTDEGMGSSLEERSDNGSFTSLLRLHKHVVFHPVLNRDVTSLS